MDTKVKKDRELGFEMIKNILIEQNKHLLKQIAKDFERSENNLLKRYLKPEYYLPIVQNE